MMNNSPTIAANLIFFITASSSLLKLILIEFKCRLTLGTPNFNFNNAGGEKRLHLFPVLYTKIRMVQFCRIFASLVGWVEIRSLLLGFVPLPNLL